MFSGGAASWATAKRVAGQHGTDDLTLLFADTRMEDRDTYRFLHQAAENVGGELVILSDGRDIWQVFRDARFLGNTRVDICSRVLKREACDRWMAENTTPEDCRVYIGIGWDERERYDRLAPRKLPWIYEAPLLDPPYLSKSEMLAWIRAEGLEPPSLYADGFSHANCGGGCVKAGHAHWEHLLRVRPAVFAEWEANEEEMRQFLDADVAILRDRAGGESAPLTLKAFRERIQAGRRDLLDLFANEADGCGGTCFYDPELEAA